MKNMGFCLCSIQETVLYWNNNVANWQMKSSPCSGKWRNSNNKSAELVLAGWAQLIEIVVNLEQAYSKKRRDNPWVQGNY